MRLIDKSKKSNIKCEHCEHWSGVGSCLCLLCGEEKYYYNRCKRFDWKKDLQYAGEQKDGDNDGR